MAQLVRERPQVEMEVEEKCDNRTVAVNGVTKICEDLSAMHMANGNGDLSDTSKSKAEAASAAGEKKNRIQVSNTKKPLFFYLNLAKRYIKQYNDVELSALGMAIPTVVTIAEILKANGVAVEKKVLTSTVGSKDETKGRLVQKAKIEIVLEKNHIKKDAQDAQSDDEVKEQEE